MSEVYVLIMGENQIGGEIANWLAETSNGRFKIGFATRGDRANGTDLKLNPKINFHGSLTRDQSNTLVENYAKPNNFLISCYWPWLFPESAFKGYFGQTINFHPALLPRDKGWYPHVHQIRHNLPAGVTLHQISDIPDGGSIWVQEKVNLTFPMTAYEARKLLQIKIIEAFKSNWENIFNKKIEPFPQHGKGNFWSKIDVEELDNLELSKQMTVEEVIRAIACRNISDRSFLKIESSTGIKYVHLSFSDTGKLN